ncbi:protein argonaute-3 [Copidosoma floridanum]|uniref:protein argonaute-3 n=1 Tax=Copidosoma floridanum TaxID=29053 RepID=UPI0006C97D7F|nr:protein argonaute-3 [Copidosoma floridanum]XP_014217277.1 protein argonaute-3 [Copidosoma floridanum]XP_014217278.1 protein argonaute-3 [Copidosoma floridanum]
MASAGRGIGRGGLLDMMKKKKEEEEERLREEQRLKDEEEQLKQEAAKAAAEVPRVQVTTSSVGIGRGSLLSKMKLSKANSSSPVASTTASVTSTQTVSSRSGPPLGRGSLMSASTTASATSTQTTSTSSGSAGRGLLAGMMKKAPSLETSGETSGVLGKLSSLSLEDTRSSAVSEPEIVSRKGESGKKLQLTANYVRLKVDSSKGMFQYEVKFSPDIDSRNLRFKLIRQHSNVLGEVRNFDGTLLYLPILLPDQRTVLESVHPIDNTPVTLTVIFKKKQAMKDNVTFFNVLINRVLKALKLVRMGRHDYNPSGAHQIPAYKLEVWPGYVTAVNELEGGLLLNLDASHRVMRTETVRDLMATLYAKNKDHFKKNVVNEIVGTSVLTRYNNQSYRVDDIEWDKNPTHEFDKNGEMMSFVQYYKLHYEITVKDLNQPLLVHRSKHKTTTGETIERMTLLIPELCYVSGLTESIKSDFQITKELATVTKVNPEERRVVIRRFIKQVNGNEVTRKILADWGLELENDTSDLTGRVLDPEEIMFGGNGKARSAYAEWPKEAGSNKVLRTPNLNNWAIICTTRNQKNCNDFWEYLQGVSRRIGIMVNKPQMIFLRNDDTQAYVTAIRNVVHQQQPEMIVIIFPTIRQDKYSAVKKVCCVEFAVPSQVIISKTLNRPDRIKSVTEKIALQMNCKLGGALWALKNPFPNAMVCGVDVFHGGAGFGTKASVAAFISSLDQLLTSWHSRVCLQSPHQEIIDLLKQCLKSSLEAYRERNGTYPDKIFIYRDGVGDGQLSTVQKYEVQQYLETCTSIHANYKPKVSVIIVQKRVNTRIFEKKGKLGNPPPGTIVDEHITRRYLYDFYLVPQLVKQGTVTPTHYIVLHDYGELKTDHMQRFTYKLCHLYYNWPGTIRVPAPCQYAHKLAYLVGQSIKDTPDARLNNLLYYL